MKAAEQLFLLPRACWKKQPRAIPKSLPRKSFMTCENFVSSSLIFFVLPRVICRLQEEEEGGIIIIAEN